jgi:hypothetical protein
VTRKNRHLNSILVSFAWANNTNNVSLQRTGNANQSSEHRHSEIILNIITYFKMTRSFKLREILNTKMRLVGHMVSMGELNACKNLDVRPEMKIPHGRTRYMWKDNIRMYLQCITCTRMWTGFIWLATGFCDD